MPSPPTSAFTTLIGPPGRHTIRPQHRRVVKAWEYVLLAYFPCWRDARFWSMRLVDRRWLGQWIGVCRPSAQTIDISREVVSEPYAKLCALFIHEICHAHAPRGHGMVWRKLMSEMVEYAVDMDDGEIASLLKHNLVYHDGIQQSAE